MIATRNGAGALAVPGSSRLEEAAPADFVVYLEDPSRNLDVLESALAVVDDGWLYTRATLDRQHPLYRAEFESFFQR